MGSVFNLELVRYARRAREIFEAVKQGQAAQGRAARLDGREVVVFGLNDPKRGYVPALIIVDPDLEKSLFDLRTVSPKTSSDQDSGKGLQTMSLLAAPGTGSPDAGSCGAERPRAANRGGPVRRQLDWYREQLERMIDVLNRLDTGWPGDCRYATLGRDDVVVFGPRSARRGIEPAFVFIDPPLLERITDIHVLRLDEG